MPRKNQKRFVVSRRRPRRQHVVVDPVTRFVIPQQQRVRFRYAWTANTLISSFTLSANSVYFLFNANNIFNPNANITGENYPVGVPQWQFLYSKYYVRACHIKATATVVGVIGVTSARYILFPLAYTNSIAGIQTVDDLSGQPNCSAIGQVGPVSGNTITHLMHKATTTHMLSRPESQLHNAPDTSGFLVSSAQQPTSDWYWFVAVTNNSPGAILPPDINFIFEITYECDLFQPGVMAPIVDMMSQRFNLISPPVRRPSAQSSESPYEDVEEKFPP